MAETVTKYGQPVHSSAFLVTAKPALREFWYPVCFATDLDAAPVGRRVLGVDVVVWSGPDGRPRAAPDRCPHRDTPLSGGWYGPERELVCPYHRWEFGAEGECRRVPAQPAHHRLPTQANLQLLPAVEVMGIVFTSLSASPLAGLPPLRTFGTAGWRCVQELDEVWRCPAPLLVDHTFDLAHSLDRAQSLDRAHAAAPGPGEARLWVDAVEVTGTGLASPARVGVRGRVSRGSAHGARRVLTELVVPFVALQRVEHPDGLNQLLVRAVTPVDDVSCRLLQLQLRNDSEFDRPAAALVAEAERATARDRALLERVTHGYALDVAENVHVPADRASVALRRLWGDVAAGTWRPAPAVSDDLTHRHTA
jgi:phenylpropionate dioxygenase-like ring-hydroxylating dioxygenase large terminal subunit